MTKYSRYKDFQLRKQIKKESLDIFILKSFLFREKISQKSRFKIMLKINKVYQNLLGKKIKNRCMISTKVRSVNRMTNLTKAFFQENLKSGKVSAFRKASW